MRGGRILAIALVVGACRGSTSCHTQQTRDVAIGWRGQIDDFFSPCAPVAATPTHVVARSSDYEAIAAGTEDFDCKNGLVVHVRVAPAVRIAIDFPSTLVVWEQHPLRVFGEDASGRQLDIGGQFTDTSSGVLVRPGCGDMDFLCGVGGEMLVAHAPGRGSVTATFHGLSATRNVTAVARPDAGAD